MLPVKYYYSPLKITEVEISTYYFKLGVFEVYQKARLHNFSPLLWVYNAYLIYFGVCAMNRDIHLPQKDLKFNPCLTNLLVSWITHGIYSCRTGAL